MSNTQKEFGRVRVKAVGSDGRTFRVVASDGEYDRDNDRLFQSGWDLRDFRRSPTILWAHDHSIPAIAKALSADVVDGLLVLVVQFPPLGIHPLADSVCGLIRNGQINSMSVGFMPLQFKPNDKGGIDYLSMTLHEVSWVNVAANPRATIDPSSLKQTDRAAVTKWLGASSRDGGDDYIDLADDDDGDYLDVAAARPDVMLTFDEIDLKLAFRDSLADANKALHERVKAAVRVGVARGRGTVASATDEMLAGDAPAQRAHRVSRAVKSADLIDIDRHALAQGIREIVTAARDQMIKDAVKGAINQLRGRLD